MRVLASSLLFAIHTKSFSPNSNILIATTTRSRLMKMTSSSTSIESLLNCPKIQLNDGSMHPQIGFGTYKVGFIPASASSAVANLSSDKMERTARECVADALSLGYRFLDCAEFYGNESEVGKAIADSEVPRKDLYLASKVWTTTIEKGPEAVRAQVEKTMVSMVYEERSKSHTQVDLKSLMFLTLGRLRN